jgi:hypothetical protein
MKRIGNNDSILEARYTHIFRKVKICYLSFCNVQKEQI